MNEAAEAGPASSGWASMKNRVRQAWLVAVGAVLETVGTVASERVGWDMRFPAMGGGSAARGRRLRTGSGPAPLLKNAL